jgi:hypothetical protein
MLASLARTAFVLSLVGRTLAFEFGLQTGAKAELTKCGAVNVIWQGGSPPFNMVVIVRAFPVLLWDPSSST